MTTAPSTSAAPLPNFAFCIQLADNGGRSEPGTEQCTRFVVGCQARDNGAELGTAVFTDWAGAGGGTSEVCTDANSFDPDQYRVFLETRPLPPGAGFSDFRRSVNATDRGEGDGFPAFTGWASQNGGVSQFAADRNAFDPDGFRIGLEVV